ncbi:hypothetical protein ES707_09145 [subsurface metagenome]
MGRQFPGALAGDQPLGVHVPEVLFGLLVGKPFFFHPGYNGLGDADTGLTGAQEDDSLFGEGLFGDAERTQQAGQYDRAGALDVIVKNRGRVAVFFEEAKGVGIAEVLKLDDAARPACANRVDELINEFVIGFAALTGAVQSQVEGILPQLLVIRAYIEADREGHAGVNPGCGHV